MTLTTRSGADMSGFCFGAMQFGDGADASASEKMYHACRDAGLNFFDTAYVYTGGESERILGALVAPEREDVIVATKAAYDRPSTPSNIFDSIDESLSRLNTDYVDILYLHRFDPTTPLEKSFDGLAEVLESGKALKIGVSNFAAWQVMKAQGVAADRGIRIDILQPMYSLVKRQVEVEILPMALAEGIAVAPYSPLGGGLLTGRYIAGGDAAGRLNRDARYKARYGLNWMHDAATALTEVARQQDVHPATLAVAWAARHPAVTAPIISARSLEQLAPSLAAVDFQISDALYEEIAALSPAPPPATDRLEEA